MSNIAWEVKRDLRIELLQVSDRLEKMSVLCREKELPKEYSAELSSLQIKVTELIGRLWTEK